MKRIVFAVMLVLLAVFSSATIAKVNSATGASIVISPDTTTSPGSTFVLNLTINNVNDMRAWDVVLVYSKIITLDLVDTINDTTFTDGAGLAIFNTEDVNSTYTWSDIARTTLSVVPGSGTGSGLVAQLTFLAVSNGKTTIDIALANSEIMDSNMRDITPITATTPTITVATPQPTPPPRSVGGWSFSVAKDPFAAPYIGLVSIAIIAVGVAITTTAIYFKGIKRRKEKRAR